MKNDAPVSCLPNLLARDTGDLKADELATLICLFTLFAAGLFWTCEEEKMLVVALRKP